MSDSKEISRYNIGLSVLQFSVQSFIRIIAF